MTWDRFGGISLHLRVQLRSSNLHDQIGRLKLRRGFPCDRGLIEPRSWLIRGAIVAHDHLALVGHDCREIVATHRHLFPDQTAEIFGLKSPLKMMYSLFIS